MTRTCWTRRTRTRAAPGPRPSTSSRPAPARPSAVGVVLPAMAGRLDGVALRVPVVDGSISRPDASCSPRDVTVDEINEAFARPPRARAAGRSACATPRRRSFPRTSIGDPASCVFDARLTQATGRTGQGVRLVRQRVGLHQPARRSAARWSAGREFGLPDAPARPWWPGRGHRGRGARARWVPRGPGRPGVPELRVGADGRAGRRVLPTRRRPDPRSASQSCVRTP